MSKTRNKFSPEVRDRAVRHGWRASCRLRLGVGGDDLDRPEDRMHSRDAAPLVP